MIDEMENFCRVFEMPSTYPEGFCFGGGKPVQFTMIDWFQPIPTDHYWKDEVKEWADYAPMIREFMEEKNYIKPDRQYILITDFGESLVIKGKNLQ